jgi:hypothetical protein
LKLTALSGKQRETDCASTYGLFRIVQPTHSPKTKYLKRWPTPLG